jgi:hypothetical protein
VHFPAAISSWRFAALLVARTSVVNAAQPAADDDAF